MYCKQKEAGTKKGKNGQNASNVVLVATSSENKNSFAQFVKSSGIVMMIPTTKLKRRKKTCFNARLAT